jgi:hypothetical protein
MQTWHRDYRARVPSGARNQHRVSGDQQDSVDSAGQLCRHEPATVLIEFLNNRLCHYGVFG